MYLFSKVHFFYFEIGAYSLSRKKNINPVKSIHWFLLFQYIFCKATVGSKIPTDGLTKLAIKPRIQSREAKMICIAFVSIASINRRGKIYFLIIGSKNNLGHFFVIVIISISIVAIYFAPNFLLSFNNEKCLRPCPHSCF